MNTGVQRSGATPPAARTANTKPIGPEPGNVVRPGQERAADRDGARDPVRRDGDRGRPARPGGQGRARDGVPRRALPPRARAVPARLGHRLGRHDPHRPAREGDRPLPGLRGRATARSSSVSKIRRQVAGRGVPAAAAPLRASVRRPAARRRDRRGSRRAPTATSGASACSSRRGRHADERRSRSRSRSTSARASPTRPAAGARSAPSTSTGCRRATTPARPARTSRSGSTTPRRAAPATSAPGGRSWRTTRSRP